MEEYTKTIIFPYNSMSMIRLPKDYSHDRKQYGDYGGIYYKHTSKQLIMYGIKHPSFRADNKIDKQVCGKSRYYTVD